MDTYLNCLRHIYLEGKDRSDRTGTGTRGVFGLTFRHNMSRGFPLLTTKKIHIRSVIHELLWFLSGDTNVKTLQANKVTIWDEWADPVTGDLGPIYGYQWRNFGGLGGVDQITQLVRDLRTNPFSRRHVVSAWNPNDTPRMKLPPCHMLFQLYVEEVEENAASAPHRLSLQMYQRSADFFLGVPFNIASYAFMLEMLAHVTGYTPGDIIIQFGDAHIYSNHFPQVREQLGRSPVPLPDFKFARRVETMYDFRFEDFIIDGYVPQPAIPAPIAV